MNSVSDFAGDVVGHVRPGGRNDREARRHHQQRVAVGRRLGDRIGADHAAGGRAIVDDHRLPERALEIGAHEPRHHVVEAAGRERHDQPDRTARIVLRRRNGRHRRDQ
jgi:hypothetical protein